MSISNFLNSLYNECEIAQENIILNQKDLYLNFNNWKNKKGENILYITGLSGSGKTSLAEQLEIKHHAEMFEIDGIEHGYDSSKSNILKAVKEKFPWYAERQKNKWNDISHNEKIENITDILHYVIQLMHNDEKTLYILEGIQIFEILSPESFKYKPIILKGTSLLNSIYRRLNRPDVGGNQNNIFKEDIPKLFKWYAETYKDLSNFKKELPQK